MTSGCCGAGRRQRSHFQCRVGRKAWKCAPGNSLGPGSYATNDFTGGFRAQRTRTLCQGKNPEAKSMWFDGILVLLLAGAAGMAAGWLVTSRRSGQQGPQQEDMASSSLNTATESRMF